MGEKRSWKNGEETAGEIATFMTCRSPAGGSNELRSKLGIFTVQIPIGALPPFPYLSVAIYRIWRLGGRCVSGEIGEETNSRRRMLHVKCCSEIRVSKRIYCNIPRCLKWQNLRVRRHPKALRSWNQSPPHPLYGRYFRCVKTKGRVA